MHCLIRFMIALALSQPAAGPFSSEEIALAQIMQGEAHHRFMGDDFTGAYYVGWVARNRLESGKYGETYAEIQGGFNGTSHSPPRWEYLDLARLVLSGNGDLTQGALYVFSQQDVERLGFAEERATLTIRASEHRALLFFAEWPEDNG